MKRITIMIVAVAILGAWSCSSFDPIQPGTVNTGRANFARFHAVGNSFTAGTQNGGLVTGFQNVSVPALIAAAAQAPGFEMPLISEPGIAPTLYVASYSPLVIDTLNGLGSPTNSTYAGIYGNLGIPGADLHDLLVRRPVLSPTNPFFGIILRDSTFFGPTAVDQIVAAQPTFLSVWAGVNDVLGSASVGTDALLTPASLFASDYATMMTRFDAAAGAVVAANIPNILAFPFFSTLPPVVLDPTTREPVLIGGNPVPLIGVVRGAPGPLPLTEPVLVTLPAAGLMAQGIGIPAPLGGTGLPLPDAVILDADEIAAIVGRTAEYNTTIDTVCAARGIPVVNASALFADMVANGVAIHGEGNVFTSDFLTGGLFSVDGIHPSSLGYWVVAREFVRVINLSFGASIPQPLLPQGPLRDPALGTGPAVFASSIAPAEWRGLWLSLGVEAQHVLE